jgi:hypothetical protein
VKRRYALRGGSNVVYHVRWKKLEKSFSVMAAGCIAYSTTSVHVPDVPLTAKKRGSGLVCVELQMPSNLAFAFVNFIPCREK